MYRTDVINKLIDTYGYESYLEIGLNNPHYNYFNIHCKHKECVDPYDDNEFMDLEMGPDTKKYIEDHILTYKMTSDEFFAQLPEEKKYDIIFIDGLHLEEQVSRDIINSLKHLNINGKIVVHDCIPDSEIAQREVRESITWNGTTWKALPMLGELGVEYYVVDTDWGCGVISYKSHPEELHPRKSDFTYDQVFSSWTVASKFLNVITIDEFLGRCTSL